MIRLQDVSKYYQGKAAVEHVSFDMEEGDKLVLLGTSGCGKTTTLKMINRLVEPSSGTIYVNGRDIRKQQLEELRRNIGYVIQSIGLFPHYTVAQNIGLVPSLIGWPEKRIRQRSRELMQMTGLPESLAERMPHELSGGQQQRVGLARALAADPEVILMDEPFGALDPITKQQIMDEFRTMEALLSRTLIMVTHDVFEAVTLGKRICLMDKGRIQQMGTPKELIFRPANTFVREFFNTQRFRLELKVLRLEDLLPYAEQDQESVQPPGQQHIMKLSVNESLLDTLEALEKAEAGWVLPEQPNKKSRPDHLMSRESLLNYFYQLKDRERGS